MSKRTIEPPSPNHRDVSSSDIGQGVVDIFVGIQGVQPIRIGPDEPKPANV
jgi:hypothetical protein